MDYEKALFFAKIDSKTERYDDMIKNIKCIIETKPILTNGEQNLLWTAYKNAISLRRNSLKHIKCAQTFALADGELTPWAKEYQIKIEDEIRFISNDLLSMIDTILIPSCSDTTSRVFYLKLRGDVYRYLAEISAGKTLKEVCANAAVSYKQGSEVAVIELSPTDPLRLGLALNFAVFFYEIMGMQERAMQLLKGAYTDALVLLDTVCEENYQDVMVALQLMRDNLYMWSNYQLN